MGRRMSSDLIKSHPLEYIVGLGCTPHRGIHFTILLFLLQGRVPTYQKYARGHPASDMNTSRHIQKGAWDKELFKTMNKHCGNLEMQDFSKYEMTSFVNGHLTRRCAKLVLTMC